MSLSLSTSDRLLSEVLAFLFSELDALSAGNGAQLQLLALLAQPALPETQVAICQEPTVPDLVEAGSRIDPCKPSRQADLRAFAVKAATVHDMVPKHLHGWCKQTDAICIHVSQDVWCKVLEQWVALSLCHAHVLCPALLQLCPPALTLPWAPWCIHDHCAQEQVVLQPTPGHCQLAVIPYPVRNIRLNYDMHAPMTQEECTTPPNGTLIHR